MNKIRKILSYSFLFIFLSLSFLSSAFCFGEYEDKEGNIISFRFLPNDVPVAEKEKEIFVASLVHNYRELKPEKIKPHFKNREEITNWLAGTFEEEWNYLKKAKHPIKLIDVFKGETLVGCLIIEQWNDEKETLHLRQMAFLPDEQRHGYGAALIEACKKLPDWPVNRIIADTRILNDKARRFYKKIGFIEGQPNDPELAGNGNYLGLEWSIAPEDK